MKFSHATVLITYTDGTQYYEKIQYITEIGKLKAIHDVISCQRFSIFQVIFYTEKDGCKILDKALWGKE